MVHGPVARRQVAPLPVLPPRGELLPKERHSVVIRRAIAPSFLILGWVAGGNCTNGEIDIGHREKIRDGAYIRGLSHRGIVWNHVSR